jgi:ribosome modulation factor
MGVEVTSTTAAKQRGRVDYFAGKSMDDNPYKKSTQKTQWFIGWLDARTETKLGHLFKSTDNS